MRPKALILFATGTNRDQDAASALELAGAQSITVPLTTLRTERVDWSEYQILVLPGGFSYADALGAGKLLALDLTCYFSDQVNSFVESGKPVIGICNGFQALVKSGILPELRGKAEKPWATLTFNASNHFECRWVSLKAVSQSCLWTRGLDEILDCPVAHGEGNFQVSDPKQADELFERNQVAFVYTYPGGEKANGEYPVNPNGSVLDIAGICNPRGNVLGLMPHPEDHIFPFQTPDRFHRPGHYGRALFENSVRYVEN
jgi:phosphoribosylformylglycinamidine synthase subunit PurQ / glutaminase